MRLLGVVESGAGVVVVAARPHGWMTLVARAVAGGAVAAGWPATFADLAAFALCAATQACALAASSLSETGAPCALSRAGCATQLAATFAVVAPAACFDGAALRYHWALETNPGVVVRQGGEPWHVPGLLGSLGHVMLLH